MATSKPKTYKNFIGGRWVASDSGDTYKITNPAKKTAVLGEFQTSTAEDALRAVGAAKDAFPGWADSPCAV